MRKEILFSGRGGQGIQLVGEIFAKTLEASGAAVSLKSSYGPEAQGGNSFSQVVIKESPEDWPEVTEPDILLALSQEGYDAWISKISSKAEVFFDIGVVKTILPARAQHIPVPATKMATDLGSLLSANMVMLGAMVAVTEIVFLDNLFEVIKKETGRFSVINLDAVREGYKLGKKYLMKKR